jgi:hypothetical protein
MSGIQQVSNLRSFQGGRGRYFFLHFFNVRRINGIGIQNVWATGQKGGAERKVPPTPPLKENYTLPALALHRRGSGHALHGAPGRRDAAFASRSRDEGAASVHFTRGE